jgi:hypothetical protein
MENNNVEHPAHYNNQPIEVIEMMRKIYGDEAVISFCHMNAFKYRMRAGLKGNTAEDIEKAKWYEAYASRFTESKKVEEKPFDNFISVLWKDGYSLKDIANKLSESVQGCTWQKIKERLITLGEY